MVLMMDNNDIYRGIFIKVFELTPNANPEGLVVHAIPLWDSIGHMQLIAALEEAFGIMFQTEDIINFSSYKQGKEILAKYDIGM
jgi:acyl carrier protein